jgi:hypothetical protein
MTDMLSQVTVKVAVIPPTQEMIENTTPIELITGFSLNLITMAAITQIERKKRPTKASKSER